TSARTGEMRGSVPSTKTTTSAIANASMPSSLTVQTTTAGGASEEEDDLQPIAETKNAEARARIEARRRDINSDGTRCTADDEGGRGHRKIGETARMKIRKFRHLLVLAIAGAGIGARGIYCGPPICSPKAARDFTVKAGIVPASVSASGGIIDDPIVCKSIC